MEPEHARHPYPATQVVQDRHCAGVPVAGAVTRVAPVTNQESALQGRFGNKLEDFSACCNPVSFTILGDGNIITCEKGVARVKVYDTFGNLKGFVAEPKQLANVSPSVGVKQERVQRFGFDVAADEVGHVYILDRARNVVRIFKRKAT